MLLERESHVIELVGGAAGSLVVAIGRPVGAVEYHCPEQSSPILIATADGEVASAAIGPAGFQSMHGVAIIPPRYCLPFDTVKTVAGHFYETRTRSTAVQWEAIRASLLYGKTEQ